MISEKELIYGTKEYYQEKLKDVRTIYVVGLKQSTNRNWDAGHWKYFDMYYITENKDLERIHFNPERIKKDDRIPHWNKKHLCFENSVLGMNRVFDIVYNLGIYLFDDGYKFKDQFLSYFN